MTTPIIPTVQWLKGIADIVADWDANRCGPFKAMKRIKKHLDSLTFQPGNDLHIGYEAGMKLAKLDAPVAVVVDQDTAYSAYPYGIKKLHDAVNLRAGTLLYAAPQPAPAIDLEQLRKTVADAMNFIAHFSWAWNGTGQHPNTIRTDLQSLLALIDLQAPTIDLERYAVAIQYAIDGMREAGGITNVKVAGKLASLLALIDGQANVRSSPEHCSELATDLVTDDAVRRLVRAMENTPGDDLIEPNTRLCRRLLIAALQPTKGEGVQP